MYRYPKFDQFFEKKQGLHNQVKHIILNMFTMKLSSLFFYFYVKTSQCILRKLIKKNASAELSIVLFPFFSVSFEAISNIFTTEKRNYIKLYYVVPQRLNTYNINFKQKNIKKLFKKIKKRLKLNNFQKKSK